MSYYIPSKEQVEKAMNKVLKKFRIIQSQNKLKELVVKELTTRKRKPGLTGRRLRRIALDSGFIKLEIHTREGDPNKIMNRCPVCNDSLQRVKNLTIWGGEVTIEFRCTHCGYWTGKKKRIPTKYVFHLKKQKKI